MTRSQTIALLTGPCGLLLLAGVAWYAYAPGGWSPKLLLPNANAPHDVSVLPERPAGGGREAATELPAEPQPAEAVPPNPLAKGEKPSTGAPARPEFDVVRVEPTGEAVIAGRGQPGDKIKLMAQDKVIGEIEADASGQFVLTPKLPAGSYDLKLSDSSTAALSQQSVAVSVGSKPGDKAMAALSEPGKPTVLLTEPQNGKSAGSLAFLTADADRKGLYATGHAAPGARLRLYADDLPLTEVTAGRDGRWSVHVDKLLPAGGHKLRADGLDAGGQVVARAEIPFDMPADLAAARAEPRARLASRGAEAGKDAVVQRGDSLWRISRKILGAGPRYTQIYEANSRQIRNPDLIYPGQVFVLPRGR